MWLFVSIYVHFKVEEVWLLIHEIIAAVCSGNDAGESWCMVQCNLLSEVSSFNLQFPQFQNMLKHNIVIVVLHTHRGVLLEVKPLQNWGCLPQHSATQSAPFPHAPKMSASHMLIRRRICAVIMNILLCFLFMTDPLSCTI